MSAHGDDGPTSAGLVEKIGARLLDESAPNVFTVFGLLALENSPL
jgi:hypothetical protein